MTAWQLHRPDIFSPSKIMESKYTPEFPDGFDTSVRDFIASFYRLSDNPAANDQWVRLFDDEATLVMGPNRAQGKAGPSIPRGV